MPIGTIKNFSNDRGFGFIKPDNGGGTDVFVHVSEFEKAGLPPPREGDRVTYDVGPDRKTGKTRAENIRRG